MAHINQFKTILFINSMEKLGTVIATEDSPSVSEFSFVIHGSGVKRGHRGGYLSKKSAS